MNAPPNAAEFVRHLGGCLAQVLPPPQLARVNVAAALAAATPALVAGWPPTDLVAQAVVGVATGTNPGALLVGNLRTLAALPPPTRFAPDRSDPVRVTAPQPLPECAGCGQPIRRGAQLGECPGCRAPLRLVELDVAATVRRTPPKPPAGEGHRGDAARAAARAALAAMTPPRGAVA
jgi:hypothetical protein